MQYRFIEPLDILNFRGNKSFGEGGEHGESQMPPMPSIFSGAIRSNWLAQQQIDLKAFSANAANLPQPLHTQLGSPAAPGSFRIQALWLARRVADKVEILFPLPADLIKLESGTCFLKPHILPASLESSAATPQQAILRAKAEKPEAGQWLTQAGIQAYLRGEKITKEHTISSSALWKMDARLGIALDVEKRTAEDGRLYTTEAIAMEKNTGFVVGVTGAEDLPQTGQLRLGGDGRGASMMPVNVTLPEPDWLKISKEKRFRLVLTTPALFEKGWLPGSHPRIPLGNGSAALVCATLGRHGVISGWDLARWRPKEAERIAPAGSVYWLENFDGDIASLQSLITNGIGVDNLDPSRRAEGFNNIMIANWA